MQMVIFTSQPRPRLIDLFILMLILIIHINLLIFQVLNTSITADEAMNVAAGVSYWKTGRFHIYRVNPPLTKLLAVLPVMAVGSIAEFDDIYDIPTQRAEFRVGPKFIEQNRERIVSLVCLSRLLGIAWSALGGLLIFRWASELYGRSAGYLSLVLWCIEPYILGHAALVTSDVPATVAGLAASYTLWCHLRRSTWLTTLTTGCILGIALLTKFTLIVFYVLWPLMWLCALLYGRSYCGRNWREYKIYIQFILIIIISIYIINSFYLWNGFGRPLGNYPFISQLLSGRPDHKVGNRFHESWLGNIPVPFPEDFLRGIDVQRCDFEGNRLSYLAGTWAKRGWWYYYLYALAVKLPLGTLAVVTWGLLLTLAGRSAPGRHLDDLMLLAPAVAILMILSSQTGYTQHSRYAIPALPYLMINAGRLVGNRSMVILPLMRRLAWCLLLASVISSLRIYPHSLSYFNEAIGGPLFGHDYLVDSNIDWGQDLIYLKKWTEQHTYIKSLIFIYYNMKISPELYGLNCENSPIGLSAITDHGSRDLQMVGPLPGYYAVSVNALRGVEFPIATGHWKFRQARPKEFEYFRFFHPIDRAGYSIYIYHINAEEANDVRARMGLPVLGSE